MVTDFITVDQVKTLIISHKDNLGGLDNARIIEFLNFANQTLYPEFASISPNRFLSNQTIKTISNVRTYALPSDFRESSGLKVGNVLETKSGSFFGALNFDAGTVPFTTIPQTITGGTSGATGTLSSIADYGTFGTLTMTGLSTINFLDDELLTGSVEGSATSNETVNKFEPTKFKLIETDFADTNFGYFLDKINIEFTPPVVEGNRVYIFRYLPKLAELTDVTSFMIIPIEYKEYARNVADIFFQQYHGNKPGEFDAAQRTEAALEDMIKKISTTPRTTKSRARMSPGGNSHHRHDHHS